MTYLWTVSLLLSTPAVMAFEQPELLGALCRDSGGADSSAECTSSASSVGLLQRATHGSRSADREHGAVFTPTAQNSTVGARKHQKLTLIGAALPKTGTVSLQAALQHFGYKVEHAEFTEAQPVHPAWTAWRLGDDTPALELLEQYDFDSTLDTPYCFAYQQLMARNPDAKVILTVHPGGPQGWARSLRAWMDEYRANTLPVILVKLQPLSQLSFDLFLREMNCDFHKPVTDEVERNCMEGYVRWQEVVRKVVPRSKLLEFNASRGWEPLVRFLGLPVPDIPFPHLNAQDFS